MSPVWLFSLGMAGASPPGHLLTPDGPQVAEHAQIRGEANGRTAMVLVTERFRAEGPLEGTFRYPIRDDAELLMLSTSCGRRETERLTGEALPQPRRGTLSHRVAPCQAGVVTVLLRFTLPVRVTDEAESVVLPMPPSRAPALRFRLHGPDLRDVTASPHPIVRFEDDHGMWLELPSDAPIPAGALQLRWTRWPIRPFPAQPLPSPLGRGTFVGGGGAPPPRNPRRRASPRGLVRTVDTDSIGALHYRDIDDALEGALVGVEACYERVLADSPTREGALSVKVVAGETGEVLEASHHFSTLDEVAPCVLRKLR